MKPKNISLVRSETKKTPDWLLVAGHLQALANNPLNDDDIVMFAMFKREDWPDDKRCAYIRERALADYSIHAAK